MKQALVLAGGGAKGAYQAGCIKALHEMKYEFDIVTGTSSGAIKTLLVVKKDYQALYQLCDTIKISDVLKDPINLDFSFESMISQTNLIKSFFKSYLNEALEDFKDDSIVVKFIGDKSGFNDELRELMIENEESSKDRDGMVLNIAMNYGSRDEIVRAVRNISEDVRNGKISSDDITENLFSNYLYTAGQPDPDLIIRPSGEYRISNFLLWQSAYTEFVIMNKLWPDFQKSDLDEALKIYSSRNRRYGGV